jgi:putative DNA methylase
MKTEVPVITRKKLIEVAVPLDAINAASAREKSIRHGHPSTLHLWWARRPLAAARAVIFAQMVDDPSAYPELFPTEKAQETERQRLFDIIKELVMWKNTTNEQVLERAREEIWQSWRRACAENADHPRAKELFDRYKLPAFHDPFAGGGSLPLEAQRLGLESYASDLNPVAVLINKAMIEIPPKFAGRAPVNPETREERGVVEQQWLGAQGLAEDVRYYGQWMRNEAENRIGHLYPKVAITAEMAKERPDLEQYVGQELTVIAWLWARTVKSPNPAFADVDVPLISNFMLSTRKGKEAYVEPVVENGGYRFAVKVGRPKDMEEKRRGTKLGRGANFECIMSGAAMEGDYIKAEGKAGRMGARLMAVVAEGQRERVYVSPLADMETVAHQAKPEWKPEVALALDPRALWTPAYGLTTFGGLFTPRQLVALTTFSDLVQEAIEQVRQDAQAAGWLDDGLGLDRGGTGATAYAEAVGVYLGIGVSRQANRSSTLNFWDNKGGMVQQVFARQALPMTWDYVEGNPLSSSTGNFLGQLGYVGHVLLRLPQTVLGKVLQADASGQCLSSSKVISTDPPYYDNIGYADLSDFFYVWMRRALRPLFPNLLATVATPKAEELVATPYRHEGKAEAEAFFMDGMTQAMRQLAVQAHPAFPVTIYYAFKQSESDGSDGTTSTAWETFLEAVISAGFSVGGTWPVRTEYTGNLKKQVSALASSIVLVCRPRPADAPTASRREFLTALRTELPTALVHLQRGNIAPVDLAQAAIGPGMAVYTRYAKVLDADGERLTVREALALINQALDEVLAEQEGDVDADTRWALAWFEQHGFEAGEYGVAETLSKAKNTSVSGMVQAGFLRSTGGQVRLLTPDELAADWDPARDTRLTVWESVHQLVRTLETGGERIAAQLVRKLSSEAEMARDLAYRLYTMCERKKWAREAFWYNSLVQSWPEIIRLSQAAPESDAGQSGLFAESEG